MDKIKCCIGFGALGYAQPAKVLALERSRNAAINSVYLLNNLVDRTDFPAWDIHSARLPAKLERL